jgi:protein-S-isoprenylcysteine O-methyltransferase Ste14
MRLLWRALKGAAADLWAEPFLLIVYNFTWLALSVLIVPLPFALGGLFYSAREVSAGHAVGLSTFFAGGRSYAGLMYRWGALNLAVGVALVANISFYGRLANVVTDVLQSLLFSVAMVWLLLQLFSVPLMFHLKQPGLRVALHDGFYLMLRHPVLSIVLTLIVTTLVLLSAVIPLVLIGLTGALIAVLSNRIVAEELAWHAAERGGDNR